MKKSILHVGMLRSQRTEHAKLVRRVHGDDSGMCRFADKVFFMALDGIANTLTAGQDKFNLLEIEYDYD